MQIISSPRAYSPAYAEAVFEIEAAADEVINVDIFNNDNSCVIGRKRIAGAGIHNVNVANYAKRQFDVKPVASAVTGFVIPEKRIVNLKIEIPGGEAQTKLNAGIHRFESGRMLSGSPQEKTIRPGECDELSFLSDEDAISADAVLSGSGGTVTLPLASINGSAGLKTLLVNMEDMSRILAEKGRDSISDYDHMAVKITAAGREMVQEYEIADEDRGNVRLCWWNPYGQIDYYTFRGVDAEAVNGSKTKIYSFDGYRVVGSEAETVLSISSDFEDKSTMRWLGEIVAAPRVWMISDEGFEEVDIITGNCPIKTDGLNMLNIAVRKSRKTEYQNL